MSFLHMTQSALHTTQSSLLHTTQSSPRQPRQADPDYEIIYRFPYITTVRLICRLKIYQTALTLAAVPATVLLQDIGAATKVQRRWVSEEISGPARDSVICSSLRTKLNMFMHAKFF